MNIKSNWKRSVQIAFAILIAVFLGVWLVGRKPLSYEGESPEFWLAHLPMVIYNGDSQMRFHPEDTSYQGRPAHQPDKQTVEFRQKAPVAIRYFGTNILPILIDHLVAEDTQFQDRFREFKARHSNLADPSKPLLSPRSPSYTRRHQANAAILELGPVAKSLVPSLWRASAHTNEMINRNARYLLCQLDRKGVESVGEDYARQNPELVSMAFADVRKRFRARWSNTTNFADIFPHLPWQSVAPYHQANR